MNNVLVITPSVHVWKNNDCIVFDRKFYDGIMFYLREWPGQIHCIMTLSNSAAPDFGTILKTLDELPFRLTILPKNNNIEYKDLRGASIVLASGDSFKQFHLSQLCTKHNIKCVYIIEYIPETRYQINSMGTSNKLVLLRRNLYVWNGERKRVAAFRLASGIQANGSAAYDEYSRFDNCILYFDTRVNRDAMISDNELSKRLATLEENRPLNLAFSGRLIAMKGADHLIQLANSLKNRGVSFKMKIYGSGELENDMIKMIESMELNDLVTMAGVVDFHKQLLPEVKSEVDLYVILHRQSDPSCTYMETLSCGVPIVGYENRAFAGILRRAHIGWGAALEDIDRITDIIEELNSNREWIKEKSQNGIEFARNHDFETTFINRINHLRQFVAC